MTLNNNKITPPNQYDDPNAVSTNILQELKKMGMPSEFAPAKLKQGHGEAVCVILSGLLDKTLQATGFVFKKPIYPEEGCAVRWLFSG
jgi:estrogen-related receptor beta like 1